MSARGVVYNEGGPVVPSERVKNPSEDFERVYIRETNELPLDALYRFHAARFALELHGHLKYANPDDGVTEDDSTAEFLKQADKLAGWLENGAAS